MASEEEVAPAVTAIGEVLKWWESKDHSRLDLEALRKIMARDPAVQAMVLRAAAKYWETHNMGIAESVLDDDVYDLAEDLADAIEKGSVKLEIPE